VGRELRIGDDVVLEITNHCPRCAMTTLAQGDLPKDSEILRTAARHNEVHVGVYAEGTSRRESPARRPCDPRLSIRAALSVQEYSARARWHTTNTPPKQLTLGPNAANT
jgi:hypothetical protein